MSDESGSSPSDKMVSGICELLALLFGLPIGEEFYRGTRIALVHYVYLEIAILFAGIGGSWRVIRRKFPQNPIVLTLGRAAQDARNWIFTLLIMFVFFAVPRGPTANDIASAVVQKLPSQGALPPIRHKRQLLISSAMLVLCRSVIHCIP